MEVNYRWKKHYKTAKYPIRQPAWLTWVIWTLSRICLIGKKYTIEHSSSKPKLVELQKVFSDKFQSGLSRGAKQVAIGNIGYVAHPLKGSISDKEHIVVFRSNTPKRKKTRFPLPQNLIKHQSED